MKKINSIEQLKWLARSSLGGAIFATSTTYVFDIIFLNLPEEIVTASPAIGVSITSFWWLAYQMDLLVYRPRKKISFAYSVSKITPMDDPDIQTRTIPFLLNEPSEFVFSHSRLPVDIKLSRLSEFLGAGMRRQRRAASKINHRFLISQAWSMKYFTKSRTGSQRFEVDEVLACRILISVTNKWSVSPRQGHPGRLHQHTIYNMSYHKLADDIKEIWIHKTGYKPPSNQHWIDRAKRRLKRFI